MTTPVEIRPATAGDLPAITAIYNDVIATTTAVYSPTPTTLAERQAWFEARARAGFPVLVARRAQQLIGFASFGEFRSWPGYRYSVEHTVHVHRDHRGQGAGSSLVLALLPLASALGKHVMIGGIDAANSGSLRMHERLGFRQVAHFHEVGRKFGRWLDLVFVQRLLDAAGAKRDD
jgi:L-amino acid N-acyltransferase